MINNEFGLPMNTNKKKKIIISGPLASQSGYGQHARQLARWAFETLEDKGSADIYTDPVPWGITPWFMDTNAENGLIGRIYQSTKKLPDGESFDISFQVKLPNEWNPLLAEKNVGVTAVVETTVCNPTWIDCCNRMDLVIVPSSFTKEVLENTCKQFNKELTTKVVVVPENFPDAFFKNDDDTKDNSFKINEFLDNEVKTDFNFLVFGQITGNNPDNDRKNIPWTIKWIYDAFSDNPNVGIILKTNRGRNSTLDRNHTTSALTQLFSQIKAQNNKNGPKLYLLHGHMTDDDLRRLYSHNKVKALVTATRGEGFGIPLLEAAACDLPVIATNWSGHKDFLDKGKFIKLDYHLAPIHPSRVDNTIFVQQAQWANVNEQDIKRKLRKFYESSSMPKQWAKDLGVVVRREYSFNSISCKYNEAINPLLF